VTTALKTTEVTLRYFAWVREKVGRGEERVALPADLVTVGDLVDWLKSRGPEYAAAFERAPVIRVALDQTHVNSTAALAGAREIAFFPPVTGG
jgi:molybdopterin synthase sulfur carrier subunit